MLSYGSIAVARVQRRVMVVQGTHAHKLFCSCRSRELIHRLSSLTASRPHDMSDRFLDVYTFMPSSHSGRTFAVSDVPCARINSGDLLTIFDDDDVLTIPRDTLELPQKAYDEFSELSSRKGKRFDAVWAAWKGKFR